MTFAAATAVVADGDGAYSARIHPGWDIAGNANGGYLLSIAARAMCEESGREDPVTITAHYLRPGRPGPVSVETETVKRGRAFTTVRATLRDADGVALQSLLGTFGQLGTSAESAGAPLVDAAPPELPPIEACAARRSAAAPSGPGGAPPGFVSKVDLYLHPEDSGFGTRQKSGQARMRGWFRLLDGEAIDTIALLQATDAFPPTIFNLDLPVAWAPTVELTAHVRARPAPGPLRCRFTTRFVSGGFLEEDGEVWDATGVLVAQSRQLALLPRG